MDYIVNLYELDLDNVECLSGLKIVRSLSPNSDRVLEFIKNNFSEGWVSEAKSAVYKTNPTCMIAIDDGEIVGFACYDATAKGFFGPTGVNETYRGKKVGRDLLLKTLQAMKYDGYGYAIIGWAGEHAIKFYEKNANAKPLYNKHSVYDRLAK